MSGADELALLEVDVDRLRISNAGDVVTARAELLATESLIDRVALLNAWSMASPRATSQLLRVIARDPSAALELAPLMLATRAIDADDVDEVLAAAYPGLRGAWRDAASDRPGMQSRLGIVPDARTSVAPPDATWMWPVGLPFPSSDSVEGVQARLNYLGLGAGPVDGKWTELTQRAFVRWQVLHGFEPTGELDWDATEHLGGITPLRPDG